MRERILQMVQNLESGEVLLEPETIAPNVTVADLQKTVELRYRATTPISSASTEDRTENIRIAFAKINGMSIPNGSKFSFNDTVGPRNFSTGFLPAIEYAYGTAVGLGRRRVSGQHHRISGGHSGRAEDQQAGGPLQPRQLHGNGHGRHGQQHSRP